MLILGWVLKNQKLVAYLIAALMLILVIRKVDGWREDSKALIVMKANKERNDEITRNLETEIARVRGQSSKRNENLRRELGRGDYSCVINPDGVQLLRNAATR